MADKKPVESLENVDRKDALEWQRLQLRKKAALVRVLDERGRKDKSLRAIVEERNRELDEREENQGYTSR